MKDYDSMEATHLDPFGSMIHINQGESVSPAQLTVLTVFHSIGVLDSGDHHESTSLLPGFEGLSVFNLCTETGPQSFTCRMQDAAAWTPFWDHVLTGLVIDGSKA